MRKRSRSSLKTDASVTEKQRARENEADLILSIDEYKGENVIPFLKSNSLTIQSFPSLLGDITFPQNVIEIVQMYCLDNIHGVLEFCLPLQKSTVELIVSYLLDDNIRDTIIQFFSTKVREIDGHLIGHASHSKKRQKTKSRERFRYLKANKEEMTSLYRRFKVGDYDKKKYRLQLCPVLNCVDHTLLLLAHVGKGKVALEHLPFCESTEDDFFNFLGKIYSLLDLEESRNDSKGCLLLDKKLYDPTDTLFREPPRLSLWGHQVAPQRALLALFLKKNPNPQESLRHDPVSCNQPRCMYLKHFKGYGTAKQQQEDRKLAQTNYPDREKRLKAEELLRNGKTVEEVALETGYRESSLRAIRLEIQGRKRKRAIAKDTPEYRKKTLMRIRKKVVIKGSCWTFKPKDLIKKGTNKGRPKRMSYLGKDRFPYTLTFALLRNNGIVPHNTVMMHNEDPDLPDYCESRPNCSNAAHVEPGTRPLNNTKKSRYPRGDQHPSHIFTNAETAEIKRLASEGYKPKEIRMLPTFQNFTIEQISGKVCTIRKSST